jgi:imidazolonepropionase
VTETVAGLTRVDAGGALVTPGLVDPHTHVVYGGNRAAEMKLKQQGVPYLDILAGGGGILSTVRATRAASDEELFAAAEVRLLEMARYGTTTVEIKSGYGLSTAEELRILRVIAELDARLPISIVGTFMGAHAVPAEFRGDADAYAETVVCEMIPAVARQGIARFCDVFCERGVFTVEQSRRILEAASDHGLARKIHADEIAVSGDEESGAGLAAEVGATSADHLRATSDQGLKELAANGVSPVLLPATSFCLGDQRYARARVMIDEYDLPVALATDDNPGTSPTESLQLVMALATLNLKMSPEEILAGITVNAARAISRERDAGTLELGKRGDLVIWRAYDLDMLSYRLGVNQASMVVAAGVIIAN